MTVALLVQNLAAGPGSLAALPARNEGQLYTLNLSSNDPGTDTITSWTINWGDGVQIVSGNPASVTHTYADNGNFTIAPPPPTRTERTPPAIPSQSRSSTWTRSSSPLAIHPSITAA